MAWRLQETRKKNAGRTVLLVLWYAARSPSSCIVLIFRFAVLSVHRGIVAYELCVLIFLEHPCMRRHKRCRTDLHTPPVEPRLSKFEARLQRFFIRKAVYFNSRHQMELQTRRTACKAPAMVIPTLSCGGQFSRNIWNVTRNVMNFEHGKWK